jgi:adenine-specific DNA-methyltransferase
MKGYKFRRQSRLAATWPTFVCHQARLIVEIDGGQHDPSSPREAERSRFLQSEGYRVLRFWNNEILANLDGVHETIAGRAGAHHPHPNPPIKGEGFEQPS